MRTSRAVWIGFTLIASTLVGATTGLLSWAGGIPVPLAIIAGGSATGGTIAVVLTVVRYATADGT